MASETGKRMRVASFFSGIGGFDLGFQNAGFSIVFQCEIDSFCRKVLAKHFPEATLEADINKLAPSDIPEAEIWAAGFPCQDLSLANQGKRKGLDGERSGLFRTFARLVKQKMPKWVVIENVPGLLNSHDGHDFQEVVTTLDELGYCVAWRVLDAQYFGTPQRRKRVFVVASLDQDCASEVLFGSGGLAKMASPRRKEGTKPSGPTEEGNRHANLFVIQHASIGRKPDWSGPQGKGYRNDGRTYTLDSRGSADVVCSTHDGFRVRKASGVSKELDRRRLAAIGNAVCVHVAQWIAQRVAQASVMKERPQCHK